VLGDAVGGDEFLCVLTQYFPDLVRCPDKEFALLAFTVRILRAVKSSEWVDHFPRHAIKDLLGDGAEELVAGHRLTSFRSQDPGVEVDAGQLGIVIKHSLEVVYAMHKRAHGVWY
jgi:hypothetical protein